MSANGLRAPIANYSDEIVDAYKKSQDCFYVLYFGEQRNDQAEKLGEAIGNILEEESRYDPRLDTEKDVKVIASDINRENIPDTPYSFQSDAKQIPLKKDSVDLAITNHLLCGIEESNFDDVISELERVSESKPINTA